VVVAVNSWDEPRQKVAGFMKDEKLTHEVLLQGGTVASEKFGVTAAPTSFWIDHQGKVLTREIGFHPAHFPQMEERVERLLAARKKK